MEKTGIDIFQYIEPAIFIKQLPQNKTFSKACEFSLRNVTTYTTLKNLIKSCSKCKESMCIVLECMEVIRSKLNTEQKVIFRKAEKRLAKALLKLLPEEINATIDVKCLTAVLKVTIPTRKVNISLKNLTEQTLKNIFAVSTVKRILYFFV